MTGEGALTYERGGQALTKEIIDRGEGSGIGVWNACGREWDQALTFEMHMAGEGS